jgi:pyruvate decarboxylase
LLHHTLGDGRYVNISHQGRIFVEDWIWISHDNENRFGAYRKAAEQFTFSQADITSKTTAAAQIDRILTDLITSVGLPDYQQFVILNNFVAQARPVYLTLPTNMVTEKISSASLATPLSRSPPSNDPATEIFVLDEIAKLAQAAQGEGEQDGIVILVDACAIRHGVRDEVKELCVKTGFPVYAAPMGKTAVSESYERYGGVRVLRPYLFSEKILIHPLFRSRYILGTSRTLISRRRLRMRN